MREEDKVLLLAEILGIDTNKYVEKYLDELRGSKIFMRLCSDVSKARNIDSYKSQLLIDEFEAIDFSKINTLSKVFVLYAHIYYLVDKFEEEDSINPFFYNDDFDKIKTIGEISINFDNKKYTLNDMILDERYTATYKIDYVKEQYLLWRKELVEKVREPLKFLAVKQKKLPKIEVIDEGFKIVLFFVFMANCCFLLAPIVPSNFIKSLYLGTANNVFQIIFYVAVILMFTIDIYSIIYVTIRYRKRGKFARALNIINNPYVIVKQMNNKCVNFYSYVLDCLVNNKLLEHKISRYSLDKKYISSIAGLIKLIHHPDEKLTKQFIPFVLRLFIVLFFTLCGVLLCYLFILLMRR